MRGGSVFNKLVFEKILFINIGVGLFLYGSPLIAELLDPTAPSDYIKPTNIKADKKISSVADFVLSAILISDTEKLAVINNSVVKIGDKIGDGTIVSIEQYSVKISSNNDVFEIHLFGNDIKEPSK